MHRSTPRQYRSTSRSWPSSGPNFVYAVLRYGTIGLVYKRFNLVFIKGKWYNTKIAAH